MKLAWLLSVCLVSVDHIQDDIAPNPIAVKGIYTLDSCRIQMVSEVVKAELYPDSAYIECVFELFNFGDSTTIDIGFPEMNFQYLSLSPYATTDFNNFNIRVDGILLTKDQIKVPEPLDSIYQAYMRVFAIEAAYTMKHDSILIANGVTRRKNGTHNFPSSYSYNVTRSALDSLTAWRWSLPFLDFKLQAAFDAAMKKNNYPWYVWKVKFKKAERRLITVTYSLPAGMAYGDQYRYFKYLLHTGAGWYRDIGSAEIFLRLHEMDTKRVEQITPATFQINDEGDLVSWHFTNLEPTEADDIYVQYHQKNKKRSR